jgi:16S rRNA (cytosine1407-C5)-methyltransferase
MTRKTENQTCNQLPDAFLRRLERELPTQTVDRVISGLSGPRHTVLRLNGLVQGDLDVFASLEAENIPLERHPTLSGVAWVKAEDRDALLDSVAYSEKRIYVQNLASMLPPIVLGGEAEDRILDLTAAPGSKTLQIAEIAGPSAEIAAVELVKGRFFRLKANLENHGADFVKVFLQDGTKVWRYRTEYFDRVLLDAPCSSEGRFRLDEPESFSYWGPKKNKEMVRKQKALLYSAIQATAPGGKIVYSTCSLSVAENEGVISKMLTRFDRSIKTIPLDLKFPEMIPAEMTWKGKGLHEGLRHARRIVPSELMEGFFLCAIEKTGSTLDQEPSTASSPYFSTRKRSR